MSLVKFSHTIFAMPFALIGFFLAASESVKIWLAGFFRDYRPSSWTAYYTNDVNRNPLWITLVLIILCMVFARSAAMAFNRYLDRSFDAKNPRTAIREIPKGIISASSALRFVIFNCVAFLVCTWFINPLCFFLSPVALLVVLGYSYTKRFYCTLSYYIGIGPVAGTHWRLPGGNRCVCPVAHIVFFCRGVLGVSGFDIIYALQDIDFDKSQQLYSIPAALGKAKALRVSEILHLLSAGCVVAAGLYGGFHWSYWIGVAVFIGMLIYQHSIVKPNDLSKVNIAFMTANGIASVVFAVFVIADLFLH